VLVITAQPGHKLRALQAGAKDFISKPFDLVEVRTRIRNMLEVRLLYKQLEDYNQVLEQTVQERTAELRESEARYRSLTELASDWYWEQDEKMNFTKVSGPVLEMLGIRVGPAGGRPPSDVAARRLERGRAGGAAGDHCRPPAPSSIFSSTASTPTARNSSFASAASRCSTARAASSVTGESASKSPRELASRISGASDVHNP
jgi:hypothetical protein